MNRTLGYTTPVRRAPGIDEITQPREYVGAEIQKKQNGPSSYHAVAITFRAGTRFFTEYLPFDCNHGIEVRPSQIYPDGAQIITKSKLNGQGEYRADVPVLPEIFENLLGINGPSVT